jgi:hypothetical protein
VADVLQTDDDLDALLHTLLNEVTHGRRHLWMWWHLSNVLKAEPVAIMKIGRGFFLYTMVAHAESAFMGLSRLFDRRKDAATLRLLIKYADARAGQFKGASAAEVRKLLKNLCEELTDMRQKVTPLLRFRDEALAHLSEQSVFDRAEASKNWQMPRDQLDELFRRAALFINSISSAYGGWTLEPADAKKEVHDDVRNILRMIAVGRLFSPKSW